MYSQHIARIQWSEWTNCMVRNVLSLETQLNFINRHMISKTGVYKQEIQRNFNKFKNIYYQNWAFMKLKGKVHMYSHHIARIQWSEWTNWVERNVLSLEIRQNYINRQKHPPNVEAVNQTIKKEKPRKLGKSY